MLTDNEVFNSVVWERVKTYAQREINSLYKRLSKTSSWEETLRIQGQIKGLENFLTLELDKEEK